MRKSYKGKPKIRKSEQGMIKGKLYDAKEKDNQACMHSHTYMNSYIHSGAVGSMVT